MRHRSAGQTDGWTDRRASSRAARLTALVLEWDSELLWGAFAPWGCWQGWLTHLSSGLFMCTITLYTAEESANFCHMDSYISVSCFKGVFSPFIFFLSLFPTCAYTIIFSCFKYFLLLKNLSVSRVTWALCCSAAPSPGAGESCGDDCPRDHNIVPAAGFCGLPLLSRAAELHLSMW